MEGGRMGLFGKFLETMDDMLTLNTGKYNGSDIV